MKQVKLFAIILSIVILLVGVTDLSAKKKLNPVEKLKYPPLNEIKKPEIAKATTVNGIKLRVIKDDKIPLVTLQVLLKGGEIYDLQDKIGLMSITTELLRIGGTKDLKPSEIDKMLDSQGIVINFFSQNDSYVLQLTCLKENFEKGVSLLAKILMQPTFNEEKLEELKTQYASFVARRNQDPWSTTQRLFNSRIYKKRAPFAVMEYDHISDITREDVIKTYKTFFAPGNMLTGVIGPVEIGELKQLIEKHMGSWNHQANIPAIAPFTEPKHDYKVAFANKSSMNQSYIRLGNFGIKRDLNNHAKLLVFNSIFSEGMTSRLMQRIRTKMGLTYRVRGGINTHYNYPGTTSFATFTKSESTVLAVNAFFDEINKIRTEKVSPKELADAKDVYLNSYVFQFSSPERILRRSLNIEYYNLDEALVDRIVGDVKKVTTDDIMEIAKTYLNPDKMIITILGNKAKLDEGLSKLGKVKDIDLAIKPPSIKVPPATPETLEKGQQLINNLLSSTYKGYKKLKSLTVTVDTKMSMRGMPLPMAIETTSVYPYKKFVTISVMGRKIVHIIDGKKGVTQQGGKDTPISAAKIEEDNFGSLYDIFNSKGKYKFQYIPQIERDGKTYDVLYVFNAKKNWVMLFINTATGLIEIKQQVSKIPGQAGVAKEYHSGFQTVKGIPYAFKTETFLKDKKVLEATVKSLEINHKVDASIFKIEIKKETKK